MKEHKTNTYEYGLISIVVHSPALDERERQRREERLKQAIACYGKEKATKQKVVTG